MKQFFDFLPILAFVVAYFTSKDMILATKVLVVASVIQIAALWLWKRKVEKMHLATLAVVLVMGGLTILLNDPIYIIWKPTIINWVMALVFLGSMVIKRNLVRNAVAAFLKQAPHLESNIPDSKWAPLCIIWSIYFVFLGAINLYVAFNFDEDTWVTFKLVGITIINLLFFLSQFLYLSKYISEKEDKPESL